MKRFYAFAAATMLAALLLTSCMAMAQTKTVSVLGDSYSTYEGFLTPSTNAVWYQAKNATKKTDVTSVTQTWWHQVITKKGWRSLSVQTRYGSSVGLDAATLRQHRTHIPAQRRSQG